MGLNLGESIEGFIARQEKYYLEVAGKCEHKDSRYKGGWVPLMPASYAPALNRFEGKLEVARKIVDALETKGMYNFENCDVVTWTSLQPILEEVVLNVPTDIKNIIADGLSQLLMLDRKAYSIDGKLTTVEVQWYIERPQDL